jgi:hypothetical protein
VTNDETCIAIDKYATTSFSFVSIEKIDRSFCYEPKNGTSSIGHSSLKVSRNPSDRYHRNPTTSSSHLPRRSGCYGVQRRMINAESRWLGCFTSSATFTSRYIPRAIVSRGNIPMVIVGGNEMCVRVSLNGTPIEPHRLWDGIITPKYAANVSLSK